VRGVEGEERGVAVEAGVKAEVEVVVLAEAVVAVVVHR
jgi:hypothetical protein